MSNEDSVSMIYEYLPGKWEGEYQLNSYSIDTLYFNGLEEKIEFQLTESLQDSSLVSGIEIKREKMSGEMAITFLSDEVGFRAQIETDSAYRDYLLNISVDNSYSFFFGEYDTLVNKSVEVPSDHLDAFLIRNGFSPGPSLKSNYFPLVVEEFSKFKLTFKTILDDGEITLSRKPNP